MNNTIRVATLAVAMTLGAIAHAQVSVKDPWVRGTVAKQTATGAFMSLTADEDARLVSATSPVAEAVELHEMSMDGGVMRMRTIPALALPAGKRVELTPGSHHVMLIGLKRPLSQGDVVPLRLTIEKASGQRATIEISAPVRALTSSEGGGSGHRMHH